MWDLKMSKSWKQRLEQWSSGQRGRGHGKVLVRLYKVAAIMSDKPRDLRCSMMAIINITVLNDGHLLTE